MENKRTHCEPTQLCTKSLLAERLEIIRFDAIVQNSCSSNQNKRNEERLWLLVALLAKTTNTAVVLPATRLIFFFFDSWVSLSTLPGYATMYTHATSREAREAPEDNLDFRAETCRYGF